MRRVWDWLMTAAVAVMCAVLLSSCGLAERKETEIIQEQQEEQREEEPGYET